jgi:site-specific DNA-methyltransferase (cytosine-N4-specific)
VRLQGPSINLFGGKDLQESEQYTEKGQWDFVGADTKEFTHCLHSYPAMMIPQIARELIQRHGVPGGCLFDPTCGTGTSLVEARLAGMDAVGTDLNPLARLLARTKTLDYDSGSLRNAVEEFLSGLERELEAAADPCAFGEPALIGLERMLDWFPAKSVSELMLCIHRISAIGSPDARAFVQVALSACFRAVSYQRNKEFKLYRIKEEQRPGHYVPLYPMLEKRIRRNLRGVEAFSASAHAQTSSTVCSFNSVQGIQGEGLPRKGEWCDLVLTSPPYGDSGTTVAYAQFSWLTNVLLGLDSRPAGAIDRELMGGRRATLSELGCPSMDRALAAVAAQSGKRAGEAMHFYQEYLASIRNVAAVLRPGRFACYVVGNRTVKGVTLPTDQFTAWAFGTCGLAHVRTHIRKIPNKRMPLQNSPSNVVGAKSTTMKDEYIVICRKAL